MRRTALLFLVFVFGLSACSAQVTPPTGTPTSAPPAAQPTEIPPTAAPTADVMAAFHEIDFSDVIPQDLHFQERYTWNAVGVDQAGRVYLGIGGTIGDTQDVAVVRYDPASGERKFLASLRTVSEKAGNLKPGEPMPKGHTRIVEMNGKMYLGSQGFHDIFEIDPKVRGGHLFEIDEASGTMQDLSVSDPGGVSIPNQGIVAVDVIPGKDLVVGLGHPSGQVVIYDLAARHSTIYTDADARQYLGRNISRHIVYSAKYNRIYASFAGSPMLRLDLNTGVYTTLPAANGEFYWGDGPGHDYGNEFVTGMAKDRDGSQVYYVVPTGYLYHFNVDTETLTRVGPVLTPDQLAQKMTTAGNTFSLVMSNDGKYLFAVASVSDGSLGLYRYDIAAGTWAKLADMSKYADYVFSGGEIDARGRIYFAYYNEDHWSRLMQIEVDQLQP